MESEKGGRILLVGSGSEPRDCRDLLEGSGHRVVTVADLQAAAHEARTSEAIVLHADRAARDERTLLVWVRKLPEETPAVIVGIPRGPLSRTLTFAGAREILEFRGIHDELAGAVSRALRYGRALRRRALLRALQAPRRRKAPMVGRWLGASRPIQEALQLASRLAGSRVPVLLLGEPGTGKDILGGLIHRESARVATSPYVRCMVSALDPDRVHEELRGSASRAGAFERALGGTLLLYGPGRVPPEMRGSLADLVKRTRSGVKLLIAASPGAEDRGDGLLPDRGGPAITLPPLRERPEDLLVVAGTLIDHHSEAEGACSLVGATPAAVASMLRHDWPGNIRELDETIARAVRRSSGPLLSAGDLEELGGAEAMPATGAPAMALALDVTRPLTDLGRQAARAAEILAIRHVLEATGGNVTHSARLLGVSRVHLQKRMKLYNLRP